MKVSVVIPVYNEEKYIEKCLVSLKNQIEKPDEIILVDNNCTDKTVEIAKKFPVKIIKEKKQGMIPARNRGYNEASFDIIARCDADAVLPSNWIAKIKENFAKKNIDALTGPVVFYDLPLIRTTFFAKIYLDFMRFVQKGNDILLGPNMALSKQIWKKISSKVCLNDRIVHEDIDIAIHVAKEGGRITRDLSLISYISGRRIKQNPFSFFIEYPLRIIKTLRSHRY